MSVKGSLEYQGLEDLLRADLTTSGGGRLTLRQGAHHAAFYLDEDGLYVLQPELVDADLILEALRARGVLDDPVLAQARRQHLVGGLLLDHLVAQGAIPEPELMEILAAEVEDCVLDVMLWVEGAWSFEPLPPSEVTFGLLGRICVDPGGVVERVQGRVEERQAIARRLGLHARLFLPQAGDLPPLEDEADPTHAVYTRLDGRTTATEIGLALGIPRFTVLRTVARLVDLGLARPASAEELMAAARDQAGAGHFAVARGLVLQWSEIAPEDPAPLRRLASLAAEAGDVDAQIEALCALGHLHLKAECPKEALEVFTQAMHKAPADDVVLTGLRLAAEAAGDNDAFVDGTLLTAQTKLDEGEVDAALELIEPLVRTHPSNMAVHLLRARALVQSERRTEFFEQAEVVGQVLDREGCRTAAARQVAEYFRETIAHLAPDRGDLLERFRALYDPRRRRRRTLALGLALLLVLGGAGVWFWPRGAGGLMEEARAAADRGDKAEAIRLIGQIVNRFPDAPEAQEAYALQRRLAPPAAHADRSKQTRDVLSTRLAGLLPDVRKALPGLPAEASRKALHDFVDPLVDAKAKPLRKRLLPPLTGDVDKQTLRLRDEALARAKALNAIAGARKRAGDDAQSLRACLQAARAKHDPDWTKRVQASAATLYEYARLRNDGALLGHTQELGRAVQALRKAEASYDQHAGRLRLALATLEVEQADTRCREEAPQLMVAGRLAEADAIYAHMETLLAGLAEDPGNASLLDEMRRRRIPQLVRARRDTIADIQRHLGEARAAEKAGDVERAVGIYTALAKQYWLIRFENVCTLPLRVESVPAGARVSLDGKRVGTTPIVLRYAWGSEAHVRIEAPGYAPVERVARMQDGRAPAGMDVHLVPQARWTVDAAKRPGLQAVPVGSDVLLVDRRGHLTCHARADGTLRWSHDMASVEGVRARPAVRGGVLYVARVDGHLVLLDAADGTERGHLDLPRPRGDLGVAGDLVGLTSEKGALIALRDGGVAWRLELGAVPTAGTLGAHGAFWVGTARGTVVRVDAATKTRADLRVTRSTAPVESLEATADGVLVTTADGLLLSLAADGRQRWRRGDLGDLVGTPHLAGTQVVVADRAGGVHVLAAEDGRPRALLQIGSGLRGDLVAAGRTLVALGRSGRLWSYDLDRRRLLAQADLPGHGDDGPQLLPNGAIFLPVGPSAYGLVPVPGSAR